jgi:hypothetical protein
MALKTVPIVKNITQLVCDKLSFTLDYQSKSDQHNVASGLDEMLKFKLAKNYGRRPYKRGIRVYEPDIKNQLHMLIQWQPFHESTPFVRVDFNPSHADIAHIYATLTTILPGGLDDLNNFAKVTRLDATVDLGNIKPQQLLAYYPQKQISQIHCKSGNIETLYLGKRGEDNLIVIYDKQLEIKEKNQKYGLNFPEPKSKTTRVEIRMKPDCGFAELINVENPFKKLLLRVEFEYYEDEQLWRLFMATVRHRGLQDSLSLLDDATRKKFRDRVSATPNSWWKPDEIWKAWPKLVGDLLNPILHTSHQ